MPGFIYPQDPSRREKKKKKIKETKSLSSPACSSFDSDLSLPSLALQLSSFIFLFLHEILQEQSFLFPVRGDSSAPFLWSPTHSGFLPICLNYKTNSVTFLRERHRALNCVNWENRVLQFWVIKGKSPVLQYNHPTSQLPLGTTEIPSLTSFSSLLRFSSLFVALSSAGSPKGDAKVIY